MDLRFISDYTYHPSDPPRVYFSMQRPEMVSVAGTKPIARLSCPKSVANWFELTLMRATDNDQVLLDCAVIWPANLETVLSAMKAWAELIERADSPLDLGSDNWYLRADLERGCLGKEWPEMRERLDEFLISFHGFLAWLERARDEGAAVSINAYH